MKILTDHPSFEQAAALPKQTGIRRTKAGDWIAVQNGRYIESFRGAGSKARAIRAAGTNQVIA